MARIAVLGANGNIGRRVAAEARSRGHEVTALVRDPSKVDGPAVQIEDVLDPATIADAVRGQDVLVSALGASRGPDHSLYKNAAATLVTALRSLGTDAPRLIVVGGASSLETSPGVRVIDDPAFPEAYRPDAIAQGEALVYYRTVPDVPWTYFSPAAEIGPGERTGTYRTDTDHLVTDTDGKSWISYEDYAAALIDEIENPHHIHERFTAAAIKP